MFIDASVIVAILASEPGWEEIAKRLGDQRTPFFVSPLVKFEATLALARHKAAAGGFPSQAMPDLIRQAHKAVDAFIEDVEAEEIEISADIGAAALEASARYGKSVNHPAALNFGDCFAYACAKTLGTSLAYKGRDFAQTDLA